jgi:hypothetical protein
MTRDEALQKVAKLLRLTTERGATQDEAAQAAGLASALMSRYEIDAAAIALQEPEAIKEEVKDFGADPIDQKARERWRGYLAIAIAHLHGCHCYRSAGRLCLIGRPSDVQTVRYLYGWTVRQVEAISGRDCIGYGITYANNFRLGMVDTIKARLTEAHRNAATVAKIEAGREGATVALVLVSQAIQLRESYLADAIQFGKEKLHLRSASGSSSRYDGNARAAGRAAGRTVTLHGSNVRQLGGGR